MRLVLARGSTIVVLGLVLLLCGCGGGRAALTPWQASIPWGGGVAVGKGSDGQPVGPLAAAVGEGSIVLADSFGARLLVWTATGDGWTGPRTVAVPTGRPLVAVAVATGPQGAVVYAADGAAALWRVAIPAQGSIAGPAQPVAELGGTGGTLTRVLGLVASGTAVYADVLTVGDESSTRTLWALEARPRAVVSTVVARVAPRPGAGAADGPGWLLAPVGVRGGLGSGPGGSLWVAGRPNGRGGAGPVLYRVDAAGRPSGRRPFVAQAAGAGAADFLGLGPGGLAYAVTGARGPSPVVVGFDARGRSRWQLPLPASTGPALAHRAALGPGGQLLVLSATPAALDLRLIQAGP